MSHAIRRHCPTHPRGPGTARARSMYNPFPRNPRRYSVSGTCCCGLSGPKNSRTPRDSAPRGRRRPQGGPAAIPNLHTDGAEIPLGQRVGVRLCILPGPPSGKQFPTLCVVAFPSARAQITHPAWATPWGRFATSTKSALRSVLLANLLDRWDITDAPSRWRQIGGTCEVDS